MRAYFPFHTLGSLEFEDLVCHICQKILGTGTISFADGPDGGRDAAFEGVAQHFPSKASPLKGKFIIQAKHTSNPVGSCSDKEFATALDKEKPKIKKLVSDGELDHYLLFTNRKNPANKITAKQKELLKLKLKSAHVLGDSNLRNWLVANKAIWRDLGFDRFDRRLDINPADLADIVVAFNDAIKGSTIGKATKPNFLYSPKAKKNKLNAMSKDYFEFLKADSLPYFANIEDFLKNPRNEELREKYEDTANEIKGKIITSKELFSSFDEALTTIYDEVVDSSPSLKGKRRFVNIFLHYMYWTCDVGQNA